MFVFPYHNNISLVSIILEFIAIGFSISSVVFAQKNHIYLYPIGIVSTTIYSYLTFVTSLYGDFIINIYYTGMSFYGWYIWIYKKDKKNKKISITFSNKKDYFYTALLFVFTCIFSSMVYSFNGKIKNNSDWMDVFTTGIFFSGMYQMAMKKVENWIFWIVGNIISIPLYFLKGLVLTGLLFILLTVLAIEGYVIWNKEAKN
ncbi:MAG: nicotinamide riboside transporter PnuC [Flavobacteriales bacterium]|jgi:nicotinamide mononucleotide transporter|uniref:nicotinamide riboside transporter PnuC n=1 Tax=Blattabacterium sp. (Mastotermes darwiniensis) TaxID=39768 RepID=UPI000231DF95|nr:nicotinamide riboside transporter PnuC [Blattabacterium sp. (Mastotermes darwiniensis)]AER40429.1 Nicotinamide mononucleotide transporter PnuC [Blattabacterium sp. (Mastotermes darwiniensis) str. MADAR]MDR1804849.1 nicotinamide riboside transporter PnuC [Flavobacteriales bacterium]